MRHAPLAASIVLALGASACGGGASGVEATAPAAAPPADSDPGFSDYAAAKGIQTLNGGGGGDAPEVTADGLRLEALDKDKPVKLDGVPAEWPPSPAPPPSCAARRPSR